MRRRRGVTLVEALIALTLLTAVLVQLGQSHHAVSTRLWRERREQSGAAGLRPAFARFAADCAHVIDPGFRRGPDDPAFDLSQQTGSRIEGRLTFYVAEYEPPGSQDIRRVTYQLRGGALTRTSEPPRPRGAHLPASETTLLSRASDLEFSLHDGRVWTREWVGRRTPPVGLEMRFRDGAGNAHEWRRGFAGVQLP